MKEFEDNELRASDIDKASIHWLKTSHLLYRRFDTNIDIEILEDKELTKWEAFRDKWYWKYVNSKKYIIGYFKHAWKCYKYKQLVMHPKCLRCEATNNFFIIKETRDCGILECTNCYTRYRTAR